MENKVNKEAKTKRNVINNALFNERVNPKEIARKKEKYNVCIVPFGTLAFLLAYFPSVPHARLVFVHACDGNRFHHFAPLQFDSMSVAYVVCVCVWLRSTRLHTFALALKLCHFALSFIYCR